MNGFERISAALAGRRADTVPVMLHNFMMAAREAGITMHQYRTDPEALARAFIQAVETYGYDGILVDIDTATLAGAVGVPVDLPEDGPGRCTGGCLADLGQVDSLPPVDIARYPVVQVWLEGVRLLVRYFGGEIFVRGNCDQDPYDLACLMRGMDDWMMDLMDPSLAEHAHRLLEYCEQATRQFLGLMSETGAHMLSNGDSMAGPDMVSPRIYHEFAFPYEKRIAEYSHELGLPYVLHICGKTNRILDAMAATGSDGLELDYKTDSRLAHDVLKDRTTFIGNIDPNAVLALGTPALVEEKTRELLAVFSDTPRFILNGGCALPATTPPENLRAMIACARSWAG
jgi:MtaA/CmuA family methyltransferase